MKTGKLISPATILFSLVVLWGSSCTPEPIDLNNDDTANIQNESASDTYFSDSEDMTSVTVTADKATGREALLSRTIVVNDPRLACATVTIVPDPASTLLVPIGILTIDFGAGCQDNHSNTRKGIIQIAYHGRRFLPGSSLVTTLTGYEINGIKVEGSRSVTNASNSNQADPHFTTTMTGGKITWPDGTYATREETITREWKLGTTTLQNQWMVTGSAAGQRRKDTAPYSMTITKALVYKNECAANFQVYVPVAGTKELIVGDKKISIDFGNGNCDKLVTITIKSKSKTVLLN